MLHVQGRNILIESEFKYLRSTAGLRWTPPERCDMRVCGGGAWSPVISCSCTQHIVIYSFIKLQLRATWRETHWSFYCCTTTPSQQQARRPFRHSRRWARVSLKWIAKPLALFFGKDQLNTFYSPSPGIVVVQWEFSHIQIPLYCRSLPVFVGHDKDGGLTQFQWRKLVQFTWQAQPGEHSIATVQRKCSWGGGGEVDDGPT